jgi:hypothetical protein
VGSTKSSSPRGGTRRKAAEWGSDKFGVVIMQDQGGRDREGQPFARSRRDRWCSMWHARRVSPPAK